MSEKLHTNPDSAPVKTGWEDMDVVNTFHKLNDYDDPGAAYAEHLARVAKKNAEAKQKAEEEEAARRKNHEMVSFFRREDYEDQEQAKDFIEKANKTSAAKEADKSADTAKAEASESDSASRQEAEAESKPDSDYGQDIRDVMEEMQAEQSEEQDAEAKDKKASEDASESEYGQDIRDVMEEMAAEEEAAKKEAEEKEKREAEEKEQREAEEKEKAAKQEEEQSSKEEEQSPGEETKDAGEAEPQDDDAIMRELDGLSKELEEGPLTVVIGDRTEDKKDLAHDYAERQLNKEVKDAKGLKGFVSRIWKGNLFKKFYEKKYEREILSGKRKVEENGQQLNINEVIEAHSESAMKRMVLGAVDEYARETMVHKDAHEKLTEADEETTKGVKEAIEWFAGAEIPEGGTLEDLKAEFNNRIGRLYAENRDQMLLKGQALATAEKVRERLGASADVAEQARMSAEHQEALNRIMEGFKVYNANVRDNIRTEAHRDNIDKLVNWCEEKAPVFPAEIIAAAAGMAFSFFQSSARVAVGAGFGGVGVSSIFAGLRERNRVTEDRARFLRDAAMNNGDSAYDEADEKGRLAKKRAKYEAKLGGTMYNIENASDLTSAIEAAKESDNPSDLIKAIAEARIRIEYSDKTNKDLIAYSSADKIGDERLALDLALLEAERGLSDEDKANLAIEKRIIQKNIKEDVEAQDKKFKSERSKLALKAAGKNLLAGTAFMFGSQELIAAIDPTKIGVFEKAGLLKTTNTEDASETILASLMGGRGTYTIPGTGDEYRLEENGFKPIETRAAYTETETHLVDVDPAEAATQKFKYDGWADNGTKISDGNEVRAYLENGQFRSGMHGVSTVAGQKLNYEELAAAGRMKGYLTIGGAKFEVVGVQGPDGLTWGDDGVFTTTTGEVIKAVGDNGEKLYKYFEIAVDNGTDAEGFTHIIPFATDVGRNTFSGTISKVTETIVEHPATYDYVKDYIKVPIVSEATRDLFAGGVNPGVFGLFNSRVGLGEAHLANSPDGETAEEVPEEAPAEAPEETSSEASPEEAPNETSGEAAPGEGPSEGPEEIPAGAPEQPTETPEATGEGEGTNSETSETSEQAPEQPAEEAPASGEEEPSPQELARRRVFAAFGDAMSVLTPAGVGFMTSDEPADANLLNSFESWWDSLAPETQEKVRTFERDNRDLGAYGAALRVWLEGLENNSAA